MDALMTHTQKSRNPRIKRREQTKDEIWISSLLEAYEQNYDANVSYL